MNQQQIAAGEVNRTVKKEQINFIVNSCWLFSDKMEMM
jgi:hypothetical protein